MNNLEVQKPSIKKLEAFQRKAISMSQDRLIKSTYLQLEGRLPLVVQPEIADLNLATWARNNQAFIETQLLQHGAILFRDFNVDTVSDFEQFAQGICPELFGEYGDLPREGVSGKVYGSTPYPAEQAILFHNESSHMHRWPMKIWFYCVRAAQQGGETPIVDCRQIYELIEPKLRERFTQKGLMYVRNYTDGLDVDWRSFFHSTDRSVVEDYCRKVGMDFEWKNGDGLRTRQICPAVAKHPKTGEMVFFNQIQLHHVSCLEPAVRESISSMFREEDFPRNVYYGDGSPIEDSVIEEILKIYGQAKVSFPWQEGDIIMLDNMLAAHGRNPFVGERKIVVTLGEMINKEDA
jgi:alpha-ketoglutarate-dependent taurine dioxygenase